MGPNLTERVDLTERVKFDSRIIPKDSSAGQYPSQDKTRAKKLVCKK